MYCTTYRLQTHSALHKIYVKIVVHSCQICVPTRQGVCLVGYEVRPAPPPLPQWKRPNLEVAIERRDGGEGEKFVALFFPPSLRTLQVWQTSAPSFLPPSFPPSSSSSFYASAHRHFCFCPSPKARTPNHQRWYVKCKLSRSMYALHVHVFWTFGADLYAQSVLINKISASELSLLKVRCWLGRIELHQD